MGAPLTGGNVDWGLVRAAARPAASLVLSGPFHAREAVGVGAGASLGGSSSSIEGRVWGGETRLPGRFYRPTRPQVSTSSGLWCAHSGPGHYRRLTAPLATNAQAHLHGFSRRAGGLAGVAAAVRGSTHRLDLGQLTGRVGASVAHCREQHEGGQGGQGDARHHSLPPERCRSQYVGCSITGSSCVEHAVS